MAGDHSAGDRPLVGTRDERVGPLSDIRVLAIEQYGAGPFGSMQLADLGAEVIKIEDPNVGGDVGRYVPPYAEGEDSLFFESFNRGKRSLTLDLSTAAGRGAFTDLVSVSDAVYSNLRGDVPERLGITYRDLAEYNPAIVCCSLSGFGMTGPRREQGGYDYILQALAGWMTLTGEPGGPPAKTGLSLVDFSGGLYAGLAMLAAVHQARRDGKGTDCDISLFEAALAMLSYLGTWHLTAAYSPARTTLSAHPSLVPFQVFEASDSWIVVAAPKEKFFIRLATALQREDLSTDPRFVDFAARDEHRDALLAELEPIFRSRTAAEWSEILAAHGVPSGTVQSVQEAMRDPQTLARGSVIEVQHPRWGTVRQVATPLRVAGHHAPPARAPQRGEHTRSVLTELIGYTEGRLAELEEGGAFGPVAAFRDPTDVPTTEALG
nr:CoA transferase [Nakamurella lactea]